MRTGTVYLVGAGPGDPKLLTLRGQELLRAADVVVYDHLVAPQLLRHCRLGARLLYVGKESGKPSAKQGPVNRLLIREAKTGKTVVRLKGGDPVLFGRGGEEALELARAKVRFELVPGVTSALAVPAYAGIPVTHRALSSSIAIVTGHEDPAKPGSAIRWDRLATACDTLVCLMGVATLPGIVAQLTRHGRRPATPCAVIEWGTCPRQRTVTGTLKTIVARARRAAIRPPAVAVIGEVVRLRPQLAWFERRPLFGTRILVTRASDRAEPFAEQLEALGAEVERLPAIELVPVKPNGLFKDAVKALPQTDWVFFTSPEGIGWFSKLLKPHRRDLRSLSGCHIGAIGPKTAAAVESHGVHVDFVPRRFSQEGILSDFPPRILRGKRALILSAEESRDVLESGLRRRGMRVTTVPIYRTVIPRDMAAGVKRLFERPFDFVAVTSASCAEHLFESLRAAGQPGVFRRLRFASIGPVTSTEVRAHGGRVAVEAGESTIEGLVRAMAGAHR
jgi:uroporphyrinogen III methyltransferase/synthase